MSAKLYTTYNFAGMTIYKYIFANFVTAVILYINFVTKIKSKVTHKR